MSGTVAAPQPLREVVIDVASGRVAALRNQMPPDDPQRGGAPPVSRVLALHGWLDNAASFVPIAPLLHGIDLVAIDLPGHGLSAHLPPGADYSFAGTLNTLLDVADALGWEEFSLLGHSMGSGIASLLAAACPARIRRLVAIEALGALAEQPEQTASRLREAVDSARALRGKSLRVFPQLERAIEARMRANGLSEPVARLLVERGTQAVAGGFAWRSDPRLTVPTLMRLAEVQVDNLVAGIACPTLVIYADPPQSYFPEPLRTQRAGLLPDGRLHVMPGGHHLHMEDPQGVADVIGTFLAEA